MIIVMSSGATEEQIEGVVKKIMKPAWTPIFRVAPSAP